MRCQQDCSASATCASAYVRRIDTAAGAVSSTNCELADSPLRGREANATLAMGTLTNIEDLSSHECSTTPFCSCSCRQEDRCWLVMDLARGGDLHNKVFDELNMSISRGQVKLKFESGGIDLSLEVVLSCRG